MAIIGANSSAEAGAAGPPLGGSVKNFEPVAESAPPPRSGFTDADGRTLTIADFRGKVVLLNFWATWCAPCVHEMPSLERLHRKLSVDDFTVIAVSEDRQGWEKIAPFREKLGLRALPLFHDTGSALMFEVKARGLPTTLLIGRDGREVGRLTGPAEWDTDEAVALIRHYLARGEGN